MSGLRLGADIICQHICQTIPTCMMKTKGNKKTAETEVSSRSLVPMTGIEPVRESLPTGF